MKEKSFIAKRIDELYTTILNDSKLKGYIFKIITYPDKAIPEYYYVLNIRKSEQPFTDRADYFNKFLLSIIKPGERLTYDNESFCIISDNYKISYTLEGYSKQPNMKGYIDNDIPSQKLLYRMGFYFALRYAKKYDVYESAFSKMDNAGWVEKYPDPADRLVALFKHERGK